MDDTSGLTASQLNALVLDYLIVRGEKEVAEALIKEAMITEDVDLQEIGMRRDITRAIVDGRVSDALELVAEFDPLYFLTKHDDLFEIQRLQLVEMIRQVDLDNNIEEVLPLVEFAKSQLLPLVEEQNDGNFREVLLDRLNTVMSLICYPESKVAEAAELLAPSRKIELASEINKRLLQRQGKTGVAKLCQLEMLAGFLTSPQQVEKALR